MNTEDLPKQFHSLIEDWKNGKKEINTFEAEFKDKDGNPVYIRFTLSETPLKDWDIFDEEYDA